jgi:hypothetical protein
MSYQIVKKQDWIITGPDKQPARGFLVTVSDPVTGDTFSLETPSLDPLIVDPLVRAHLASRRSLDTLSFD